MSESVISPKKVFITGASRGIGAGILKQLAQEGYEVMGTATQASGVLKIAESLAESGLKGEGLQLNLSDPASIQACLETLKTREWMPDILINNAGITRDNLLMRMSDEEWHAVIHTNLTGVFQLTRGIIRSMMKKRWGRIVNLGSIVGSIGNPGQANYCAAKAGIEGFSKSLAAEVATRGITVNVVAPGFIGTDMTEAIAEEHKAQLLKNIPVQSIGTPEDIAHAVSYLVSEGARYVTGQTLHVNGGLYMN